MFLPIRVGEEAAEQATPTASSLAAQRQKRKWQTEGRRRGGGLEEGRRSWHRPNFGKKDREQWRAAGTSNEMPEELEEYGGLGQEDEDEGSEGEEEEEEASDNGYGSEEEQEMSAEELAALQKRMSSLPMAKLAELKTQLGPALFNKALYGEREKDGTASATLSSSHAKKGDNIGRKKTAKRPREESSGRPPPKLRPIAGLKGSTRNQRWDPRFSSACGEFDSIAFHRDYSFLSDYTQRDIRELQKAHKEAKREQNQELADRIKVNLLRLQHQQKASKDQQLMEQIRAELRQTNIERMNKGERPIYLNTHELKARFEERKQQRREGEDSSAGIGGSRKLGEGRRGRRAELKQQQGEEEEEERQQEG